MTPPIRKDDFYVPTLQVLRDLGGSASIEEIEEKLIERFAFTQAQLDETSEVSGDHVITAKMSWARSYLKFPQFLVNEARGVWVLTEAGRAAADQPVEVVRRAIRDAKARRRAAQLAERARGAGGEDTLLSDPGTEKRRRRRSAGPTNCYGISVPWRRTPSSGWRSACSAKAGSSGLR